MTRTPRPDNPPFQRPGIKLIVGPESAREEWVSPVPMERAAHLPGDASWKARDLRLRLGFSPSLWAQGFACAAEAFGHALTNGEWAWLHGTATLVEAHEWISKMQKPELPQ